jgi:hypothetical protein
MLRTITTGLTAGVGLVAGVGLALGAVILVAGPAQAKVTGPCEGNGTFESQQKTYDANTTDKVTLPAKDTVAYEGSITAPTSGPRSHSGRIDLKLPAPLPAIKIVTWGTKSTVKTSDEGVYDYDLPAIVPRGVTLNLTGEHVDTAGTCTGSIEIEIDGGPFDAPAPIAVSVVGTVIAGAGLAFAARPKGAQ